MIETKEQDLTLKIGDKQGPDAQDSLADDETFGQMNTALASSRQLSSAKYVLHPSHYNRLRTLSTFCFMTALHLSQRLGLTHGRWRSIVNWFYVRRLLGAERERSTRLFICHSTLTFYFGSSKLNTIFASLRTQRSIHYTTLSMFTRIS